MNETDQSNAAAAVNWQVESAAIGRLVQPALEKIVKRLPQLRCASLCTPDGFNICSLGLHEDQVGKMAALASSLFSMGNAALATLATQDAPINEMEIMTMEAGGLHLTCAALARRGKTGLILFVASPGPLGVILLAIRSTANDILQVL